MKATKLLLTALMLLVFAACSNDNDPAQDATNAAKPQFIIGTRGNADTSMQLTYSFTDDGILIVDNAAIPSKEEFNKEIDGHAWRLLSQGFVLPDGSIKDNNKGNQDEYIVLYNHRRLAILSIFTFQPEERKTYYGNYVDYNDQTGYIGLFNVVKLSADYSQMIAVAETHWYPDPHEKAVHGYSVWVFERLTEAEKSQAITDYKVNLDQLVAEAVFEPSDGKEVFGAKLSELSFSYIEPGELRVNGLQQISASVFRKHIAGYGWRCESAHQIETNGTVNPKDYEYVLGLEQKKHYYFGDKSYQVFSTSYYHNNTPWYYEEKYVYDERYNMFFEINDGQQVGGQQIICLSDDLKSFYMIGRNMQNHFSSSTNDFRYNLVKFTRLTNQELKELRQKHSTNFWDLDWNTGGGSAN